MKLYPLPSAMLPLRVIPAGVAVVSLSASSAAVGLFSALVAAATLGVEVARTFGWRPRRPDPDTLAADLAKTVRAQLLEEFASRRTSDEGVLPVTWAGADPELSDTAAVSAGTGGGSCA